MIKKNDIIKLTDLFADHVKLNSLHDADKITVDCYDAARGLFNRTMTVNAFTQMLKGDTLIRKAQLCYLTKGTVQVDDLIINLQNELYTRQTKEFNLSEVISDRTIDTYKNSTVVMPKALTNWLTSADLKCAMTNSVNYLISNSARVNHGYVPNDICKDIDTLHTLLQEIDFTVHVGHAGCGKSTTVAKYVIDHNLTGSVIALSNTICNMMCQKSESKLTPFSCTSALANYTYSTNAAKRHLTDQSVIVIDEFSQWGFNELHLLNRILSNNRNAKVFFMGDIDQIPTFLSSGSLLYAVMKEFSQHVVEHNTQYRFRHEPEYLKLLTAVQNKQMPTNLIMTELSDTVLKMVDVCITGTNEHVKTLNRLMINVKHNIDNTDKVSDVIRLDMSIPLICNSTVTLQSSKCKVLRNSKYTVDRCDRDQFRLVCQTDKSYIYCNSIELDMFFDYGYAMTVNRAQGLEWDNVLVFMNQCDRNLFNHNALYVALSRGKHQLIVSTFKPAVTEFDILHFINTTYHYNNHFNWRKK